MAALWTEACLAFRRSTRSGRLRGYGGRRPVGGTSATGHEMACARVEQARPKNDQRHATVLRAAARCGARRTVPTYDAILDMGGSAASQRQRIDRTLACFVLMPNPSFQQTRSVLRAADGNVTRPSESDMGAFRIPFMSNIEEPISPEELGTRRGTDGRRRRIYHDRL